MSFHGCPTPAFLGSNRLRFEYGYKPSDGGLRQSCSPDACVSFHFCCPCPVVCDIISIHLFVVRAYLLYLSRFLAEPYYIKSEHLLGRQLALHIMVSSGLFDYIFCLDTCVSLSCIPGVGSPWRSFIYQSGIKVFICEMFTISTTFGKRVPSSPPIS
ncbi:hypothetical protein ARMSODRAFT_367151 [Armillaria solidipes]|uniref:Uncharacterized protein n=1 Tax=Armillaria solidipes TaxID=1076256 RepID=A0A2H3BG75_9AGAR|nr:hypothetical protein ARMSODRAFT_367151 [Armillaria solidipes]